MSRRCYCKRTLLALFLLAISGCSATPRIVPNLGKSKADITLNPGEFKVVKVVTGEASCPFFLWLDVPTSIESRIGLSIPLIAFKLGNSNLYELAMNDLHRKHDLQGKPEILHNFLAEWTLANYLGLFAILRIKISAEVIEFTGKEE